MPEIIVADSFETRMSRLRTALYDALKGSEEQWKWDIVHTFNDVIVVLNFDTRLMYEIPYILQDETVTLGAPTEVEQVLVVKRFMDECPDLKVHEVRSAMAGKSAHAELTGPIVFKSLAQQIAFAAVLVPGEPDSDYENGEKLLSE